MGMWDFYRFRYQALRNAYETELEKLSRDDYEEECCESLGDSHIVLIVLFLLVIALLAYLLLTSAVSGTGRRKREIASSDSSNNQQTEKLEGNFVFFFVLIFE